MHASIALITNVSLLLLYFSNLVISDAFLQQAWLLKIILFVCDNASKIVIINERAEYSPTPLETHRFYFLLNQIQFCNQCVSHKWSHKVPGPSLTKYVWSLIPKAEIQFPGPLLFLKKKDKKLVADVYTIQSSRTPLWSEKALMIQEPVKKCDFCVGKSNLLSGHTCQHAAFWFQKGVPWIRTVIDERNSKEDLWRIKENVDIKTPLALDVILKSPVANFLIQ